MNGKYENCANCHGWINTEATAHDRIKLADGKTVFTHYYHCTHQYFTYGEAVGNVVETIHPEAKEYK